jgi:hypothetical protein
MNLFKQNLIQRAKLEYKGNWAISSQIFDLYSFIVDLNNVSESLSLSSTWKEIILEHRKHIILNEELVLDISKTINIIATYISKNTNNLSNLMSLYRLGKYKELIRNLISYMTNFFSQLGIKVKPIKLKSDYTDLNIIGFTLDLTSSESYIADQMSANIVIHNRLFKTTINNLKEKGLVPIKKDSSGVYTIYNKNKVLGFITYENFDEIYPTLEELKKETEKNSIIENIYDKLTLGEEGVLYTPQGEQVSKLDFLNPEILEIRTKEYNSRLDTYNIQLKPYETKLTNEPKTIQLGDHTLKVVKVLDNNITRPVIIEGPYKGIFLDQIVSSTGKVLGSSSVASPYFTQNKKIIEAIGTKVKPQEIMIEQSAIRSKINDVEIISLPENYIDITERDWDLGRKIKERMITKIPHLIGLSITQEAEPELKVGLSVVTEDEEVGLFFAVEGTYISMERGIYFKNNKPDYIENYHLILEPCLPDGLGTRILGQQIKTASEENFKHLKTLAAGNINDKEYVGYYVWPKFGYNTLLSKMDFRLMKIKNGNPKDWSLVENWLIEHTDYSSSSFVSIQDIYACKVKGKFIGQELWKEYGKDINVTFDLTPGSLSMRIFDSYIQAKAKKENIPLENYLNIDYSKYSNKSANLECLTNEIIKKVSPIKPIIEDLDFIKALIINIKNHENGVILKLLNNKNFIFLLNNLDPKYEHLVKAIRSIARTNKSPQYNKFASKKPNNESFFTELDMELLNQVWDGINKLYETGTFR